MDKFSLNIAGHNLCFKRDIDSPQFSPSPNLSEFMSGSGEEGTTITVFNNLLPEMAGEEELFTTPFITEVSNGSFVKKSDRFWSIYKADSKRVIRIWDPETGNVESNLLFASDSTEWKLYSRNKNICIDPFTYPLNGLILYYLTLKHKTIIIHASAVEYKGKGYIFTGVSGKGKTTMAQLWKEAGATIINDDLLVLSHKSDGSNIVSSTPLNGNMFARRTRLNALFLIEHSGENFINQLKGVEALTEVMSNTVQHNYDSEIINNHIGKVMELVDSIPVFKMGFTPDQKAVEAIKGVEAIKVDKGIDVIETLRAILESGNSVELAATGYSMFPTLRQGDRVVIKPLTKGELPGRGTIIVCIDSGITEERHNDITNERHNSILVMHRLVETKDGDSGNTLLITRGDSGMENDKPCPQQQFLGVAVSYKRVEKEHLVKTFIPGEWRYKYNRRLLWIFNKINRLKRILVSGSKFKV